MLRTLLTALRSLVRGRANVAQTEEKIDAVTCTGTDDATLRPVALMKSTEGRPAMNAAFEKLIQHLDEREVRYSANGESQSICADFRCEVGTYRFVAAVDAESNLFQVFGYSPVRVPQGARSAVAETVARANYGLKVGKLEFDVDSGDLRFQASQILTEDGLDEVVIERLLGTTISMLDMYLPAVLSVIYGNELPKDAVRCVEAGRCRSSEAEGNDRGTEA